MRALLMTVGALLLLVGCIWFLQGVNVLPGSFMTGQRKWAVNGGIAAFVGVLMLALSRRRRR